MSQYRKLSALIPALALATFTIGSIGIAAADDTPPPNSAPGNGAPGGHHHNAAWQACKQKADDQKLEPGDARREFMKGCMKSAKDSAPPAAT
jgi:psiF repeat-containing protein